MSQIYRIILVEPSPMIAAGITTLLNDNFKIVDNLPDLTRCIERLTVIQPDLLIINPIVLDYIHRANIYSIYPQLQSFSVVALTSSLIDESHINQFDGVISIYDTAAQISKKLKKAIEHKNDKPNQPENEELSDREREILTAVAKGMTNKEIADLHNISVYTVISHRKNITRKTGIKTVSGLTVYALLNNLLEMDEVE